MRHDFESDFTGDSEYYRLAGVAAGGKFNEKTGAIFVGGVGVFSPRSKLFVP